MVEYASNEYIMFRITTRDENGNGALELYYLMRIRIRIVLFNAVEVHVR